MNSGFVPPHRSSRRAALLEQLIVKLTSTENPPLAIRTRAPDDPTIALLDAWATVGDVLGFYLDRISDEGYLTTATEPGSILALANLVGYQPAPSLAAQVHLAYMLAPDKADGAVRFDSGLLFQSTPGPGQQPQTFEAATGLLARPTWNTLAPKSTQPIDSSTTSLVVNSTTAKLTPNDVILLNPDTAQATRRVVSSAVVDYSAKVTNVTLQPADAPDAAPAAKQGSQPQDATSVIDGLLSGGIGKPPTPLPKSANLPQTPKSVFNAGSDAVPRLISTMRPAVASTLYSALRSTRVGLSPVSGAAVMQVTAAPFGAAAPPQTVFNASGQPAGTRDWPLGDTFTLQLSVYASDFLHLHDTAQDHLREKAPDALAGHGDIRMWIREAVHDAVEAIRDEERPERRLINVKWSVGTFTEQAALAVDPGQLSTKDGISASPEPHNFGKVTLKTSTDKPGKVQFSYAGAPTPKTPALHVDVSMGSRGHVVTFEFLDPENNQTLGTLTWDPTLETPLNGQVGDTQVTISWAKPQGDLPTLTMTFATPLQLSAPTPLRLDGNYPGITAGSYVVIDSADPPRSADSADAAVKYPVIAKVESVATVAASGFGITAKVTQLTLENACPWLDPDAVLQSALRPLTVHAQPAALPLQPAPVTDDVSGSSIDLKGLVAGMEPGRLIAVTGTRTDLPAGATVASGEIAMIASVSAGADDGDTPYSTLHLAAPLAYSYQRATVQIYGNVVSARQGATINQVLGSGQPGQAPQSFALSAGPVLADPASTASGFKSSLTVTVDGVGYAQASRFDRTTPAQSFLTGTNAAGQTTVVFPAPLPAGTGNVIASYRAGNGSQGNLEAGQIKQLLSRPASLSGVINPLPATGGAGGDDQEAVRSAAPASLGGLGRVVTVGDYAALATSIAGVGKASAALIPGAGVVVTVAGTAPAQLNPGDGLCLGVAAVLAEVADPTLPVQVLPANLYLIALTAAVVHDPAIGWDATVAAVQAGLLARFGYAQRNLGDDVAVSDLVAAAHWAPGVLSFTVTGLALVPVTASASALSTTLPTLLTGPVPAVATLAGVSAQWGGAPAPGTVTPAGVAYLSDKAAGTIILNEQAI